MKLSLFSLCLMAGVAVINAHVTHHVGSNDHIVTDGHGLDHVDKKVTTDPFTGRKIVEHVRHSYTGNMRPRVEIYHGQGHFSPYSGGSRVIRRGGRQYNRYNRYNRNRRNRYPYTRHNSYDRYNNYNSYNSYNRGNNYLGSSSLSGRVGYGGVDIIHAGVY